jgi:hypothetical protein
MDARFPKYVPFVLVSVVVGVAACGQSNATSPTTPTAPDAVVTASLTAEPSTVTPEFLPITFCPAQPAFRTRIVVIVSGGSDVILWRLRFGFTDRFGVNTLPIGTSSLTTSFPSIPNSMPVPIPGVMNIPHSTPIPIPGSPSIDGVLLTGGFHRVPMSLEFGCGVRPGGTLNITADVSDRRGRQGTSEVSVKIADTRG